MNVLTDQKSKNQTWLNELHQEGVKSQQYLHGGTIDEVKGYNLNLFPSKQNEWLLL